MGRLTSASFLRAPGLLSLLGGGGGELALLAFSNLSSSGRNLALPRHHRWVFSSSRLFSVLCHVLLLVLLCSLVSQDCLNGHLHQEKSPDRRSSQGFFFLVSFANGFSRHEAEASASSFSSPWTSPSRAAPPPLSLSVFPSSFGASSLSSSSFLGSSALQLRLASAPESSGRNQDEKEGEAKEKGEEFRWMDKSEVLPRLTGEGTPPLQKSTPPRSTGRFTVQPVTEHSPLFPASTSLSPSAHPTPLPFSSSPALPAASSSSPASPARIATSPLWTDWMTKRDQEGRAVLGQQAQLIGRTEVLAVGSVTLLSLMEEALPEHSHFTVRILYGDTTKGRRRRQTVDEGLSSPPASQGAAGATASGVFGEGEEGEEEMAGLVRFYRGRVLGTGGEAIVVQAAVVTGEQLEPETEKIFPSSPFASPSSPGRLVQSSEDLLRETGSVKSWRRNSDQGFDSRFKRSSSKGKGGFLRRSLRQAPKKFEAAFRRGSYKTEGSGEQRGKKTETGGGEEEEAEGGKGRKGRTALNKLAALPRQMLRSLSLRPAIPYEKTIERPLALRFGVTRRLRSSKVQSPFASAREVEAHIESLIREQKRLIDIARKFGGSGVLKNTYGLVLPCFIGKLEGYPSKLREAGIGQSTRVLLNVVTASPLMNGALEMLQDNGKLTALSHVYIAKRLIQLAANLDLLGLVHRDIKLLNILVDELGGLYLTDFQFVKQTSESFLCREIVSTFLAEPWLATCWLHFRDRRLQAHPSYDAWMMGMAIFMWLCDDFPFAGMRYEQMGLKENIKHNIQLLVDLYDPAIALPQNRDKKFPAPIDWGRCAKFPRIGSYPLLQDAIQGLLDVNPRTRLRPYDMVSTHPLFTAA